MKSFLTILFFLSLVGLQSCQDQDLPEQTPETKEEKQASILEGEIFSSTGKDVFLGEDLDSLFDSPDFDNGDLGKNNVSLTDFSANLIGSPVSYNGSTFRQESVAAVYQVNGYFTQPTGDSTIEGKSFKCEIQSEDYLRAIRLALREPGAGAPLVFDSTAFQFGSLENFYLNSDDRIKFEIYFDSGSEGSSSKLASLFQESDTFEFQAMYNVLKNYNEKYGTQRTNVTDGEEVFNASHTLSTRVLTVDNSSGGVVWPCTSSDFTFDQSNFRDQDEDFDELKYAQTSSAFILTKDGSCQVSNGDGTCGEVGTTADLSYFDTSGSLDSQYSYYDFGQLDLGSKSGLCTLNDSIKDKKATTASQCYTPGEAKMGRLVFRPKKGSFCTLTEEDLNNPEIYPQVACNLTNSKQDSFSQEYFGGEMVDSTTLSLTALDYKCYSKDYSDFAEAIRKVYGVLSTTDTPHGSTTKTLDGSEANKWLRDCTVADFRCKNSSSEGVSYSLDQAEGGAFYGCGGSNSEVLKRKDKNENEVLCNDLSEAGKEAKNQAKSRCITESFTEATTGKTYCSGDPSSVICKEGTKLGCNCSSDGKWTEVACTTESGEGCVEGAIEYKDCPGGIKRVSCQNKKWIEEVECSRKCDDTGVGAKQNFISCYHYEEEDGKRTYYYNNFTCTDIGKDLSGNSILVWSGDASSVVYNMLKSSDCTNGGTTTTNGACGSTNGTTVASKPSSNLCDEGDASSVSGTGPWDWTCSGTNGGTSADCTASKAIETSGSDDGTKTLISPGDTCSDADGCTCNGTDIVSGNECPMPDNPINGDCSTATGFALSQEVVAEGCSNGNFEWVGTTKNTDTEWSWKCKGINNGSDSVTCSADRTAFWYLVSFSANTSWSSLQNIGVKVVRTYKSGTWSQNPNTVFTNEGAWIKINPESKKDLPNQDAKGNGTTAGLADGWHLLNIHAVNQDPDKTCAGSAKTAWIYEPKTQQNENCDGPSAEIGEDCGTGGDGGWTPFRGRTEIKNALSNSSSNYPNRGIWLECSDPCTNESIKLDFLNDNSCSIDPYNSGKKYKFSIESNCNYDSVNYFYFYEEDNTYEYFYESGCLREGGNGAWENNIKAVITRNGEDTELIKKFKFER